jgi:transposase InsO family protein
METSAWDERRRFVRAYGRGTWSMAALCAQYGISVPCGYKWWHRYQADGDAGLRDQSRAPRSSPHQTDPRVTALLIAERRERGWGVTKLLRILQTRHPELAWPARSTANGILDRAGLLEKRRRRPRWPRAATVPLVSQRPNQVWPADFKGQFKVGTGQYCYPLTITDHFSRQVLAVAGLSAITGSATAAVFHRLFREVGLPDAIRTDNGVPFVSTGLHGLSALSIWWMQLGIRHHRTRPARPQDNGSHERMHRELKKETARPPAATLRAQQAAFDAFRHRYNDERPHEALGLATPASRWTPSTRPYPSRITGPAYPGHWEVRRVCEAGTIKLHNVRVFLAQALQGQDVGLEEIDDGCWRVVYYETALGIIDLATGVVTGIGRESV